MSLTDALTRVLRPEETVYARLLADFAATDQTEARALQASDR